ncbi:hypothetical protein ACLE20_13195 [Rhizobium sp. YIM 134829]|uniref:hypothetical protein n=1 Tax=Rhizobium sp. YIM 134829 TaxID=3390453 RepID=UPI00397BFF47
MREFRRLSIPSRAHPLVKRLFEEMNRQQLGVFDMADRVGINASTIKAWRVRTNPTIDSLQACFNVLGLELKIRRLSE